MCTDRNEVFSPHLAYSPPSFVPPSSLHIFLSRFVFHLSKMIMEIFHAKAERMRVGKMWMANCSLSLGSLHTAANSMSSSQRSTSFYSPHTRSEICHAIYKNTARRRKRKKKFETLKWKISFRGVSVTIFLFFHIFISSR